MHNELLVALDNDNTVSIFKCHITKPEVVDQSTLGEEKKESHLSLPSVGPINESLGIKSPNRSPAFPTNKQEKSKQSGFDEIID